MADEITTKKVNELTAASELGSSDLLLVQQGGQARALAAGDLQAYCKKGVAAYEASALAAQKAAEAAQEAAETAQTKAETAQTNAENAVTEVESKAEEVAAEAAAKVEETLVGHVSDAQAAQTAAETAQTAAETAASKAKSYVASAAESAQEASQYASDADASASTAETHSNDAMEYSNNAFTYMNQAKNAANLAETTARHIIGADVNWQATKTIVGDSLDIISSTWIEFSNAYAHVTANETLPQPGISYVVRWNEEEYTCTCRTGDGVYYLGNGTLIGESLSNDEPFCVFWYNFANNTTIDVWKDTSTAEAVYMHVYMAFGVEYEYSKLPEEHMPESVASVILRSSTEGSTKLFELTVDDAGTIYLAEVT